MPPTPSDEDPDNVPDELVPDPQVQREFGISKMTLHRWTNDPRLRFPPKVKIRERNFRSRKQIETFKARVLRQALKQARRSPDVTQHASE
jgi:hypothetical protein